MVRSAEARAVVLAAAGLVLLATAPSHRPDILLIGAALALGAFVWQPLSGPYAIGAAIPLYFFPRDFGPLAATPPGLALYLSVLALVIRRACEGATGRRSSSEAGAGTRSQRVGGLLVQNPYLTPLALFLAGAALSLLVTEYPRLSARELRAVLLEPVLFFGVLLALGGAAAARRAVCGFLLTATVLAASALTGAALGIGTEAEGVVRAQAWYPSPNHLALTLGRALPFLLAVLLCGSQARYARWLAAPAAVLVSLAIGVSFSLGAWLGVAAAVLVMLLVAGRARTARRLLPYVVGGVALVFAAGAVGILPERLSPFRATSGFRAELWLSSLAMLRDHALLGIGLDNFVYLYQTVYLRPGGAAEPNLSHPHNWLLQVWLQLGIVGLAGFLGLLWRFAQLVREAARGAPAWLVVGAAGAMVHMLVHGLIDNSYFLVDLAFLFWATLAAVLPPPTADAPTPLVRMRAT